MVCIVTQNRAASEMKHKSDGKLEYSLTNDHLPHAEGDERSRLAVGFTVEDLPIRWIRSKRKSGESVHNQVNPEKLNSREDRFLFSRSDSRDESKDDSGNVDRELELFGTR